MKNKYFLFIGLLMMGIMTQAQTFRYVNDLFTDADIAVESDLTYGVNIDFLTSKLTNPAKIGADITDIKTKLGGGMAIPAKYYNPADTTTVLKVKELKYDIYYPKSTVDSETDRPVVVYLHTGNFLPPCLNGSPLGVKTDKVGVGICMAMARKGYVAVSVDYRLGWNPISDLEPVRKGTLLNAVYRAIHDTKQCIRTLKAEAAGANKYGIDPNKVILIGEGTGAYVANSYNTLDKHSEITLPRFLNPLDSKPYVDTLTVGNLEGFGGLLNLYADNGQSSDISACIALGGALPDTSWLEVGDAPMMAFQCIRDPFAPFHEGLVIVPTTGEAVVTVQGSNLYIKKANEIGNNDALYSDTINDVYSASARSRYGKTYDYIYPSPRNKMTVTANNENQYAVLRDLGASIFQNTAQPWQWWDTASPLSKCIVQAPNVTSDMAARQSNPTASEAQGMAYIDTITGYVCPRLANLYGFVGVKNYTLDRALNIYPNPSSDKVYVEMEGNSIKSIKIFDLNGRLVMNPAIDGQGRQLISTKELKAGMYFIEVDTDRGTVTKKLSLN